MTDSRPSPLVTVKTHDFAQALLRRSNERVRTFQWGRLVVIWDTKPSAPRGSQP